MEKINNAAAQAVELLKNKGVSKYVIAVADTMTQEYSADPTGFTLLRTTFDDSLSLKIFENGRMGTASGSDLTQTGIAGLVENACLSVQSAPEDPCYDIAPYQKGEVFRIGTSKPDIEGLFDRTRELLDAIHKEFPKICVNNCYTSYESESSLYLNSNGTRFETYSGTYGVSIEFAAHEGQETTSLNYTGVETPTLDRPFIELGDIRESLKASENSLHPVPFDKKFVGTVITMPACSMEFIRMLLRNYISSSVVLDGTSRWLDRLGEKTADEKLTVKLPVSDKTLVTAAPYTADGFKAEDITLIDKGVFQSFLLNLYTANKTGKEPTHGSAGAVVVEPGNTSLEEMIRNVPQGLLVGLFSGGEPGANGEFSGVAKNSFYIENGKIVCPVTEAMISGNLEEMFSHIEALSSETVNNGSSRMPYMAFSGITVSGKQE